MIKIIYRIGLRSKKYSNATGWIILSEIYTSKKKALKDYNTYCKQNKDYFYILKKETKEILKTNENDD